MKTLLALLFFVVAANAAACYQYPVACRTIYRYNCQIRVPIYKCQTVRYNCYYPQPSCYHFSIIYNKQCFCLGGYQIAYPDEKCGPEKDVSTVVEEARSVALQVYEDEMRRQKARCEVWEKSVEAIQQAHLDEYEQYLARHTAYLLLNMRNQMEAIYGKPLPAWQQHKLNQYKDELIGKEKELLEAYKKEMDRRFALAKLKHYAALQAYDDKLKAYAEKIIAAYETCLERRVEAIAKYETYLKEEYVVSKVKQYTAYLKRVKAARIAMYTKCLLGFQVCDKKELTEKNTELVAHYDTLLQAQNDKLIVEYQARCIKYTDQLMERYRCSYTCSIGRCGYSYNRKCYETYFKSCYGFWRYQTCQVLKPTRCCRFTEIYMKVRTCANLKTCPADVPFDVILVAETKRINALIETNVAKATALHAAWLAKWTKQHKEYVDTFDKIVAERHAYLLLSKKHYLEVIKTPKLQMDALLLQCKHELAEKRAVAVGAFRKQLEEKLAAVTLKCVAQIKLYRHRLEEMRNTGLARLTACHQTRAKKIAAYQEALEIKHAKMVEAYYQKLRERSDKLKECYKVTLEEHHPEGEDGQQCDKILLRRAITTYHFKLLKHDDEMKAKFEKELEELRARLVENYRCTTKCRMYCVRLPEMRYTFPCWRVVYPCAASYNYCYKAYCQRTTCVWYQRSCGYAYQKCY